MGQELEQRNDEAETPQRKGREGARWINERPTPEDFAAWAKDNIKLPEGMEIDAYLGGIVLIPQVDKKAKYVVGFNNQGEPMIGERPEMVYIPYAKVEARVQFFWDLCELNSERWVGVIEPINTPRPPIDMVSEVIRESQEAGETVGDAAERLEAMIEREIRKPSATAAIVHQLPPGFFLMPAPVDGQHVYYLCCSYRAAIYEKPYTSDSKPIREGRGTKQVALLTMGWRDKNRVLVVDDNVIMKAETGAIGRALGAAGIFTIPGSGIATAEDVQEALAAGETAASPEGAGPAAPAEPPAPRAAAQAAAPTAAEEPATNREITDEEALDRCRAIVSGLQEDFPDAYEAFGQWCSRRRPKITDLAALKGPALRGVLTKLERLKDDARERQEERGEEPQQPAAPLHTKIAAERAPEMPESAAAGTEKGTDLMADLKRSLEPASGKPTPAGDADGPAFV